MKHVLLILFILLTACSVNEQQRTVVQPGLDFLEENIALFRGKRVGIITNHSAYDGRGNHISDLFLNRDDLTVSAFFGPEHGIRGVAEAGEKVASEKDPARGIPIYSLYGQTRKPTPGMLENVDVLVFDIQDIGARFYTYIYSMALAMEAAAEHGKPFVVMDRPNRER